MPTYREETPPIATYQDALQLRHSGNLPVLRDIKMCHSFEEFTLVPNGVTSHVYEFMLLPGGTVHLQGTLFAIEEAAINNIWYPTGTSRRTQIEMHSSFVPSYDDSVISSKALTLTTSYVLSGDPWYNFSTALRGRAYAVNYQRTAGGAENSTIRLKLGFEGKFLYYPQAQF